MFPSAPEEVLFQFAKHKLLNSPHNKWVQYLWIFCSKRRMALVGTGIPQERLLSEKLGYVCVLFSKMLCMCKANCFV